MDTQNKIQLFEKQKIRTAWDEEKEEWYFSVVDVIEVLSGTDNPRRYWSDLKRKMKKEGATQLYENIVQLKLRLPMGNAMQQMLPIRSSYCALSSLSHLPRPNHSKCGLLPLAVSASKKP